MADEEQDLSVKEDRSEVRLFLSYLLDERKYSPLTAKAYRQDIVDFMAFLDKNDLEYSQVTVPLLRTYMLDLTLRGYKKTSIRRIVSGLSQFYTFLVVQGYVKQNPFELISKPKVSRQLPDFLGDNEIEQLLSANAKREDFLASRDQALLELLFSSGLRVSELCGLTLQTVNLKGRFVRVLGKGKKERIVPFTVECQKAIEEYLKECRVVLVLRNHSQNEESVLFLNNRGRSLTPRGVQYILCSIEKKIGAYYRLHPHKLRHTFATTLLNKGADLRTIQELMGHASIGTTQIYTHVTYGSMKDTYDRAFPRAKRKPEDKD